MKKHTLKTFLLIILFIPQLSVHAQSSDAKLANEYFQQGEFDKAKLMYEGLEKTKQAIPLIHANYMQLMLDANELKEAERYLQRVLKFYPSNLQYQVDLAFYYQYAGEFDKKEKFLNELIKSYADNQYQLSTIAQNLASRQLYREAIFFYEKARAANGRPSSFALDMAAIHRLTNNKPEMTSEYINYAEGNPANLTYVKNLFQNILTEEEDQDFLEQTLIQKTQRNPNETLYSDLLIWLLLQRKDFYSAFIQGRALDKRNQQPGNECMRIAQIAYDNKSWQDAIDIYQYVINTYPNSYNYPPARRLLIRSKENKVKNEFPVDRLAIRNLAEEYAKLYEEMGPNPTTLEALRNKALLHAFYLNELPQSITLLNAIIHNNRSPASLISESKLDLGDIYLLTDQPWESTLLYSQVEKAHKESPLAYEAKLRNARLNYFTGNFSLAKSHLDILKLATTRTIANDAIALSLLISDNTVFDTTDQVMKDFASVELMIFMNKSEQARAKLNEILEQHPGHSITDEIYWLQARLELEAGDYMAAILHLDQIITQYSYDILSDDAFFRKATILHDHLHKDQEAMSIYQEFLKKYPGSRHAAEARTRIRKLRGDLAN